MASRMMNLWTLGLLATSSMVAADPASELKKGQEGKTPEKWTAYEHVDEAGLKKSLAEQPLSIVAFVDPKNWESEMLEWEWPKVKEAVPHVLSVDCSVELELCKKYDIKHYPSIRAYRGDRLFSRFRGPRKSQPLIDFATRSNYDVVSSLDRSNLTSFASSDDVNFIMYLRGEDAGKGLYKRYHTLAEEFHDRYSFGIISRSSDVSIEEEGEDAPSTLRCYNNIDDIHKSLDTFFDEIIGMRRFVEACSRQLIQHMNKLNKAEFTDGQTPTLYYFDSEVPARESFPTRMHHVAKEFADHIQIVVVDPMKFPEVMEQMTLKWEFPAMALQVPAKQTISLYQHGPIDDEILTRYIKDILQLNPPPEGEGEGAGGEGVPPQFDEGIFMGEGEAKTAEKVKVEGDAQAEAEAKHDEL